MKRAVIFVALVVSAVVSAGASDRTGIYAVVDEVIFEPNAENPERVQVWGAFAVATPGDRSAYQPVQRGYVYFTSSGEPHVRAEWNDLKSVANSKQIVAFGSRFDQKVRVRAATEKPAAADTYPTGTGVHRIRIDRDYAPIRSLTDYISR